MASVRGIVAQTPTIPKYFDNKYSNGIVNNPALQNESIKEHNDLAFDESIDVVTIFAPIKSKQI